MFPAIYELDGSEANGTVHLFCSSECRRDAFKAVRDDAIARGAADGEVVGTSAAEDGCICEHCGKTLS